MLTHHIEFFMSSSECCHFFKAQRQFSASLGRGALLTLSRVLVFDLRQDPYCTARAAASNTLSGWPSHALRWHPQLSFSARCYSTTKPRQRLNCLLRRAVRSPLMRCADNLGAVVQCRQSLTHRYTHTGQRLWLVACCQGDW